MRRLATSVDPSLRFSNEPLGVGTRRGQHEGTPNDHEHHSDRRSTDHFGRLPHHRAAELLHRLHRPEVPRRGAAGGQRPEARRPVRRSWDEADHDEPVVGGRHPARGAGRDRPHVRRAPPVGSSTGDEGSRPGPRWGRRRDHLPDRRDDPLQPQGPRVQAGVLRGLQPLDRRVLRPRAVPAVRARPDRGTRCRSGDHRPRDDEVPRPPRRDDAGVPGRRLPRQHPRLRRPLLGPVLSREHRAGDADRLPHPHDGGPAPPGPRRRRRSCRSSGATRTSSR